MKTNTWLVRSSIFILFSSISTCAFAGKRYAVASGNWNVTSVWSLTNGGAAGAPVPASTDTVYIINGSVVTIPIGYAAVCSQLYFGGTNSNSPELNFASSTSTLTITYDLIAAGPSGGSTREINVNAGTLTVNGIMSVNENTVNTSNKWETNINITTGTLNVQGDLVINMIPGCDYRQCEIYITGAGAINLDGDFILSNGIGTLYPGTSSTFNYNGSAPQTVLLSSQVTYCNLHFNNSNAAMLNTPITTANVTGNLRIQSGKLQNGGYNIMGNATKTLEVASGAQLMLGGTTGAPTGFGTITLDPNSTVDYYGTNQTVSALAYGHLKLTDATSGGSSTKSLPASVMTIAGDFTIWAAGGSVVNATAGAPITVNGNFYLNSSTSFNAANYTHNFKGNWVNNGTFTGGTSTINFNGSASQTISGSNPVSFNNWTVNNTASVSLSTPVNVGNTLTMTAGQIIISPSMTLALNSGNAISGTGFGNAKHIVTQVNNSTGAKSWFRMGNFSSARLFPVGNGTHYLPATITPSSINDFTISVFQGTTNNAEPNGTPFSAFSKADQVDAIWRITRNSGTGAVDLQLGWTTPLEGSSFQNFLDGEIGIGSYTGYWDAAQGTGNQATNTATRTGITIFGAFAVTRAQTVLPVTFHRFAAQRTAAGNQVEWQVQQQNEVQTYDIQFSADGLEFRTVGTVAPHINKVRSDYQWIHKNARNGFYRIRALLSNGKEKFSSTFLATSKTQSGWDVSAVSIRSNQLSFRLYAPASPYKVNVYSKAGVRIASWKLQHDGGVAVMNLPLSNCQSAGLLFVEIANEAERMIRKVLAE